jgi:hypothetical protein
MLKELLEPKNSAARTGIVAGLCLVLLVRVEAIHERLIGVEKSVSFIGAQNVFKPAPLDTLTEELHRAQADNQQLRAELERLKAKPRPAGPSGRTE